MIAADGTFSTVFSRLFPNSQNKPNFRGYKVYRGYSEKNYINNIDIENNRIVNIKENKNENENRNKSKNENNSENENSHHNNNDNNSKYMNNDDSSILRICDYGFQTWGPGSRFACVPTKHGNAWYIAIGNNGNEDLKDDNNKNITNDSSYDNNNNNNDNNRNNNNTNNNNDNNDNNNNNDNDSNKLFSNPHFNGSKLISKNEFKILKKKFQNWHKPVGDLLEKTLCVGEMSGVRLCNAYSFNSFVTVR